MTNKEFGDKLKGIQDKLGTDASALIADDLGILLTDNANMNTTIENKDKEINKLTGEKEKLIMANGNLLQQVGMGIEEPTNKKDESEEIKPFDFRTAFDEKGNFKK